MSRAEWPPLVTIENTPLDFYRLVSRSKSGRPFLVREIFCKPNDKKASSDGGLSKGELLSIYEVLEIDLSSAIRHDQVEDNIIPIITRTRRPFDRTKVDVEYSISDDNQIVEMIPYSDKTLRVVLGWKDSSQFAAMIDYGANGILTRVVCAQDSDLDLFEERNPFDFWDEYELNHPMATEEEVSAELDKEYERLRKLKVDASSEAVLDILNRTITFYENGQHKNGQSTSLPGTGNFTFFEDRYLVGKDEKGSSLIISVIRGNGRQKTISFPWKVDSNISTSILNPKSYDLWTNLDWVKQFKFDIKLPNQSL